MSRSVVIPMRRQAPGDRVEPLRRRLVQPDGHELRARLVAWASKVADECGPWPTMPKGVTDRPTGVWEPVLAVADAADGSSPRLSRDAGVGPTKATRHSTKSLRVRIADPRGVLGDEHALHTVTIVDALDALDEARWTSLWGEPLNARGLAQHLGQYAIESRNIRIGDQQRKRNERIRLDDPFTRYLPPLDAESAAAHPLGTSAVSSHVPTLPLEVRSDQGWDGGTPGTPSEGTGLEADG